MAAIGNNALSSTSKYIVALTHITALCTACLATRNPERDDHPEPGEADQPRSD